MERVDILLHGTAPEGDIAVSGRVSVLGFAIGAGTDQVNQGVLEQKSVIAPIHSAMATLQDSSDRISGVVGEVRHRTPCLNCV